MKSIKMLQDKDLTSSEMLARLHNLLSQAHDYTAKHSSRVVYYARKLATAAKLSDDIIDKVEVAAKLHDIGKLGIGEDILNKPSKLTDEEFDQIKKHPEIGLKILKELSFIMDVVDMVYYHHERIDGKGYPQGLKGEEIPIGARIVCIADAFDAMISKRVYSDAMPKEDAILELKKCSGTQFDSKLVDLFIKVLENDD